MRLTNRRPSRHRSRAALAMLLGVAMLLTGCSGDPAYTAAQKPAEKPAASASASPHAGVKTDKTGTSDKRPNIVLVLMDDFSDDLVAAMSSAAEMADRGASYPNSFVVDSLCCVSRTAILTGQFPHQNGVRSNTSSVRDARGALGGWPAFLDNGNPER